MYRVDSRPLKQIHDWLRSYERSWTERFDQLDTVLAELKQAEERAEPEATEERDGSD